MIHRFHSPNLSDLRDYVPSEQNVAGDVVLFFNTTRRAFGGRNSAMFRLNAGFIASGKTDDGEKVLSSYALTDMYWEKIQKNTFKTTSSPITQLDVGEYVSVIHDSDPTYSRQYSYFIVVPQTVNQTLDLTTLGVSAWNPVASTRTHPIYLGDPTNGITLNKKWGVTKVQDFIAIIPDIESDTGLTFDEFMFGCVHYGDLEVAIPFGVTEDSVTRYAVVNKTTFAYRTFFANSSGYYVYPVFNNQMYIRAQEFEVHVYKVNEGGEIENTQNLGSWGDWIPKYRAKMQEDCFLCIRWYHSTPDYWTLYEPNPREFAKYNRSGDTFNETSVSIDYIGNVPNGTYMPTTRFSTDTALARITNYGDGTLKYWAIINSGGYYEEILEVAPWVDSSVMGSFLFYDDSISFLLNAPAGVSYALTILYFTQSGGQTYFQSVTSTTYNVTRAYYPSEEAPYLLSNTAGFDENGNWMTSDPYHNKSELWIKDPTSDRMVQVADFRDMDWEDNFKLDYVGGQGRHTAISSDRYIFERIDHPQYTRVVELKPKTTGAYTEAGVKADIIFDAISITSIVLGTTLPANTEMYILMSVIGSTDTYRYNSVSTNWELETIHTNGNTVTEFNAADHNKLITQLGQSLTIYIFFKSLDGDNTPVLNSIDVDYFKGDDLKISTYALRYGHTMYRIEAVSATETRFYSQTASLHYMKGSVHLLQ